MVRHAGAARAPGKRAPLSALLSRLLAYPAVAERLARISAEPMAGDAASLAELLAEEMARWGAFVRRADSSPSDTARRGDNNACGTFVAQRFFLDAQRASSPSESCGRVRAGRKPGTGAEGATAPETLRPTYRAETGTLKSGAAAPADGVSRQPMTGQR